MYARVIVALVVYYVWLAMYRNRQKLSRRKVLHFPWVFDERAIQSFPNESFEQWLSFEFNTDDVRPEKVFSTFE